MPDLSDRTRYTANLASDSNLYVDINSDNLGIGTINPSSKLYVVGDGYFTGVVTAVNIVAGVSSYSNTAGIASFANTAGIASFANTSGIATSVIGGIGSLNSINVSGISTLGIVQISSGIITATSGIVTYYGDGSNLTGITALGSVSIISDNTDQNQLIPFVTSFGSTAIFDASSTFVFNSFSGNLGIGTTNPTSKLQVNGDVLITGVTTSSVFSSSSDKNLKENINTIENSLEIIKNLRGVKFDWKENKQTSYGVVAQELEEYLPELVSGGPPKTVNYNGIIGVLIEAIKQQQIQIEELERKLNA